MLRGKYLLARSQWMTTKSISSGRRKQSRKLHLALKVTFESLQR
jgi:hypothetical protein